MTYSAIVVDTKFSRDEGILVDQIFRHFGHRLGEYAIIPAMLSTMFKPDEAAIQASHNKLIATLVDKQITKVIAMGTLANAVLLNQGKPKDIVQVRGGSYMISTPKDSIHVVPTLPPFYVVKAPESYRDFLLDLSKHFNTNRPFNMNQMDLCITNTMGELQNRLRLLASHDVIACDLETNGFNAMMDPILSIGLGSIPEASCVYNAPPSRITIVPVEMVSQGEVRETLRTFFNNHAAKKGRVVFHNAKFDLQFLRTYLGESIDHWYPDDTMLLNYTLDERPIGARSALTASPHSLKTLARTYFDAPEYKMDLNAFLKQGHSQRNYLQLYKYQALDVSYTMALYWRLKHQISTEEPEMWPVYSKLLQPSLIPFMEAELAGTPVDRQYLAKLDDSMVLELNKIQHKLGELARAAFKMPPAQYAPWTGDPEADKAWEWTIHYDPGQFNPASPRQVAFLLYNVYQVPNVTKMLRKKPNCTDKDVIAMLRSRKTELTVDQSMFLLGLSLHRETGKIRNTYTKGLLESSHRDGRAHPEFMLNGTATGRLSCQNPNLQNQPARMGNRIRRAFYAPKGYKLIGADYSQLELRVAAYLSQDENMIQAYREDRDLHKEVAAAMFGIPVSEVTKEQRHIAKYVDFGLLYGRGAQSIADKYGYTLEYAQGLLDSFLNQFSSLRTYMQDIQKKAWTEHMVISGTGRKRRFPLITADNKAEVGRQALNSPVQSLASDFCLYAFNNLYYQLKGTGCQLLFTVHDAIYLLAPEEKATEICDLVVKVMTTQLPIECNVPIAVDAHISQRWDEEDEVELVAA